MEKTNHTTPMSEEDFEKLLKRLEDSNDRQAAYAKKQYRMSQITALAAVIVLAVVLYATASIIPRVNRVFDDMEIAMTNINDISGELAEANLGQMVTDIDNLVTSSDKSVQEALKQINSVDIATLNQAIEDLANLIRPLAKFFGK